MSVVSMALKDASNIDPATWKDKLAVAAADITDASASGLSVLTGTPADGREGIGAASSSLARPVESNSSAILFHDACLGEQTLAVSGSKAVEPGPGTITVADWQTYGLRRYENGSLYLSVIPEGGGGQVAMLCGGSRAAASGLTIMARFIPGFGKSENAATGVGFSNTATSNDVTRGFIQLSYGNAPYDNGVVQISALSNTADAGLSTVGTGIVSPGEEIAFAVKYETTAHQTYWMQGGRAKEFGCPCGGENWFMLGETFTDLSGQTVYPLISAQWGGIHEFRDIKVLSDWNPSDRHKLFDYSRTQNGIHVPSFGRDPVTGLVVLGWNKGTNHISADNDIRASVKLATGWTDAATILASVGDGGNTHIESISSVAGALWLIYNKNAVAADGGIICRRAMTVNPATGAIALGAEVSLGITAVGGHSLGLSPIITLPSGRLMICHADEPPTICYASYSDDDGITWVRGNLSALPDHASLAWLSEPCLVLESDGAVGCYMRSNGGGGTRSTYYARCADPNAETLVWGITREIKEIPQPHVISGMRTHALRHSSGRILVIGADHNVNRRRITIWEMGDNAQVIGKTPIGDWASSAGTAVVQQYPTMIEDGDDLLIAYSHQAHSPGASIRAFSRRWDSVVSAESGGTGVRNFERNFSRREKPPVFVRLSYGATPTPNMSLGKCFHIKLTGTGNTFQPPSNPFPWEEITVVFVQDTTGNRSILFHADYQFGGITPTWQTGASTSNVMRAIYNAVTRKWIVTSWN